MSDTLLEQITDGCIADPVSDHEDLELAVSNALDKWLWISLHGLGCADPGWFITWLGEHGYEIVKKTGSKANE